MHPSLNLAHIFRGHCIQRSTEGDFLAVAIAEGEGGKTSALEVEAEGEAEGLVFCTSFLGAQIQT